MLKMHCYENVDGIKNNPRNVLVLDLFDNDERYYDFRHKKLED